MFDPGLWFSLFRPAVICQAIKTSKLLSMHFMHETSPPVYSASMLRDGREIVGFCVYFSNLILIRYRKKNSRKNREMRRTKRPFVFLCLITFVLKCILTIKNSFKKTTCDHRLSDHRSKIFFPYEWQ